MKESLLMKTKTVAETMNCLKTVSVILVRQPKSFHVVTTLKAITGSLMKGNCI